jgi:hypothetical protein
MEQAKKLTW